MIQSRDDYYYYLEADRISLGEFNRKRPNLISRCEEDVIWKYQRLLRKIEFVQNCRGDSFLWNLHLRILNYLFYKYQMRTMILIQPNTFGPGLSIAHIGPLIINGKAKIGKNCRVHPYTNIGVDGRNAGVARIGDDVYLGNGCKIIGNVEIGNNIIIGAGAIVVSSCLENNAVLVGVPARVVSYDGNPLPQNRRGADICKNVSNGR